MLFSHWRVRQISVNYIVRGLTIIKSGTSHKFVTIVDKESHENCDINISEPRCTFPEKKVMTVIAHICD